LKTPKGERFFHIGDPDGYQLSFAMPMPKWKATNVWLAHLDIVSWCPTFQSWGKNLCIHDGSST
jgi:hypothetical protein